MCEAHAYMLRNGAEEKLLENVDRVEMEAEDGIKLVNIFGEQKIFKGRFKSYLNGERKILFEPL